MKSSEHYDIGVVGSGFAGSILARVLHKIGYRVILIERGRHPRFALGESSTPLAALSLERLADRYGLDDLRTLAAWGRWKRELPHLGCGLKRGFTFYRHFPGQPFKTSVDNDRRLLVAASPDEAISDCQWQRADVDDFLVGRAEKEGVAYFDRVDLTGISRGPTSRWKLVGSRQGSDFEASCDLIVDGTGRAGFVAAGLGVADRGREMPHRTCLVFGHFDHVEPLSSVVEANTRLSPGPYADESAAVHHLLDEGWLYSLRFDDGRVSAGVSLHGTWMERLGCDASSSPEALWTSILGRYPTLEAQFATARVVRPLELVEPVQHRLACSSGDSWVALPHTYAFVDPIYSTGIAWSLLGVERIADLLDDSYRLDRGDRGVGASVDFSPYSDLLELESEQMIRLIAGAYEAMDDFELFTAQSFLYFSTVSWEEIRQRLDDDRQPSRRPCWRGFLGAGQPGLESLFAAALERLREWRSTPSRDRPTAAKAFESWMLREISERNVIGLGDPSRHNLYPVDLLVLLANASKLGFAREEMRSNLYRLRGSTA